MILAYILKTDLILFFNFFELMVFMLFSEHSTLTAHQYLTLVAIIKHLLIMLRT